MSKPLFKLVVIHSDFVPFYTSRLGGEGEKNVNIPSEKYIYVH